jgi:hypothetical protein
MPSTSKNDAPVVVDVPEIAIRQLDMGGYTVTFNTFKTPLFHGLPDDACQCPHWGIVLTGNLVYRFGDHDETYTAGDTYYARPDTSP